MFDLMEPSHNGRSAGRPCPYVAISACASIGSPSVVPVPCASTTSTSAGFSPALASAARITRCCDGPFGAVSPLEAPSWFTALPATTASTRCPAARAADSPSSTTTPAPSDHPVPSAPAPYALHRPSPASPPASARSHSPARSAWHARCIVTSADEHAVSTVTAGPSRPSTYATRPEITLVAAPVRAYPSAPSRSAPYPDAAAPANTPVREPR